MLGKVLASCHNFTLNYLDNITIFSRTWEEHLRHMEEVFKQLKHADLKIKCSKCKFFKSKVHYFGYLVGVDGVQPLLEKLEAIMKLLAPTNMDELCQFLGITGFYRKFVHFYADIINCLSKLLRKGTKFQCLEQCNNAFNILKQELYKMPSLQYQDPNKPFKLFTDASKYSYSDILHQAKYEEPAQLIPIAYISGSSNHTQQLWNITQKECYVVYRSINKFSFYLTGAECTLYWDHKLLAPFLTTGMKSKTMDRWALKLQQYNIKFQHVAGKDKVIADAISHLKQLTCIRNQKIERCQKPWSPQIMSWKPNSRNTPTQSIFY